MLSKIPHRIILFRKITIYYLIYFIKCNNAEVIIRPSWELSLNHFKEIILNINKLNHIKLLSSFLYLPHVKYPLQ